MEWAGDTSFSGVLLWPWSHATYMASVLPLSPYRLSRKMGYLYVTVIFFGDEGDLDRKEVIGLPSNAELEAATLIFGINHWQAPLQGVSSTVVSILAIELTNNRCANTRSVMRNVHVKLVVQSWKNCAKENQPQLWLCSSNSTHFYTVQEKIRFPNNFKNRSPGTLAKGLVHSLCRPRYMQPQVIGKYACGLLQHGD